jgi:hypothetical protein
VTTEAQGAVLDFLKVAGGILTGAFGVLGLLTEYKDKVTNKVTTWGWIALLGIVISTVIGLSATVLDNKLAALAEAKRRTETNQLLAQTGKTLSAADATIQALSEQRRKTDTLLSSTKKEDIRLGTVLKATRASLQENDQTLKTASVIKQANEYLQSTTNDVLRNATSGLRATNKTLGVAIRLQSNEQQTLAEADRLLNPLRNVYFSYWFSVPIQDPAMADYRRRLFSAVAQFLRNPIDDSTTIYTSSKDVNGRIDSVEIPSSSPLMPSRQTEPIAYYVIEDEEIMFDVYGGHIRPEDVIGHAPRWFPGRAPSISLSGTADTDKNPFSYALQIEIGTHGSPVSAQISVNSAFSDPQYWRSDGTVLSILDLRGKTIVAYLFGVGLGLDNPVTKTIANLQRRMTLRAVDLEVDSREYWFRDFRFRKLANPNSTYFALFVPKNAELARDFAP